MVRIAHFKDAEDLVEIRKVEYDLAPIRGEELKAMAKEVIHQPQGIIEGPFRSS